MADRGAPVKALMEQGILFLIARVEIDYRASGRYGDVIVVQTRVSEITAASIDFSHVMKEKTSGRLLVECMAGRSAWTPPASPGGSRRTWR